MAQVIPEGWAVPERIRQRVGAQAGRQRAIVEEEHLLLILHELPKDNSPNRVAKVFWRAPDGSWRAQGAGDADGLPVVRRQLEAYRAAVAALDAKVDSATTAQAFFDVLSAAAPLQRAARNLHKALQEARDGVDDREVITLRDAAGEVERAADLAVSDAQNGMNFSIARNAEAQAANGQRALDAQHRLNLLAALFFPITAIGSVLGMNLPTGLEHAHPAIFWLILGMAFLSGYVIRSTLSK